MQLLIPWINAVALISLMISIGLSVTVADVKQALGRFPVVGVGLLVNFIAVPLVTAGLVQWFQAPPLVAIGFLILAVCPGAPVAPTFTQLARGDVPLATGLMVLFAGLSAVLSPFLLSTLLDHLALAGELRVEGRTIFRMLAVNQWIPLGIGFAVHSFFPRLAARVAAPLQRFANLLLLLIVGAVLYSQSESLAAIRLRGWLGMLLLLGISFLLGWLAGWGNRSRQSALAVSTSARNAAVALMIVTSHFADTPAVTAVVAAAMFSIFGTLVAARLLSISAAD